MAFFKEHCFVGLRISSQMEFCRHAQLLNIFQRNSIRLALGRPEFNADAYMEE
jgi:hypothetical protein